MEKDLAIIGKEVPDLLKNISCCTIPKELQPYVEPALHEFKNEMASELGIPDYEYIDKGELPSRLHGNIGGNMTNRMVKFAEAVLAWNYKNKLALKD
ncbi:MAG: alpha/beta-type small acid-soluble spore protein [Firmicutes bacterium]|nr:alpha/beta-type small acid-soluble spore protein [Bacillota bacterium]